jgi:Domain of Unknown Function with PDB structure (DUF3858)/Transglutaminase-like superfamily
MVKLRRFLLVLCQSVFVFVVFAQNENLKFGKITPADFRLTPGKTDSGANVLIIADIGNVKFEGNNQGSLTQIFTRFMRVKIMNKNGLSAGSREIAIFHNGPEIEKVSSLKGSTYILDNGNIREIKLDEKSVYTQKFNGNIDIVKFSFPFLTEGAIYELEYTVKSPFFYGLNPWSFQGEYPELWSEYEVTIPPPLHYVVKVQGDDNFYIDSVKEFFQTFSLRHSDQVYNGKGNAVNRRWVKTNIPSLHEESFTTTIKNYISSVSFQLEYMQLSSESEKFYKMSTWTTCSKGLMEEDDFGHPLEEDNYWMSDKLKEILQDSKLDDEKASKIYNYIRDQYKCLGNSGLYSYHSLKEIFKTKQGSIAEINLLLIAMLRRAGIRADPMILSTRDNGVANPSYPLLSEYNYVICTAFLGDKIVTLDAGNPYLGYGQLPLACYNGFGHIINQSTPMPLYFTTDSLHEFSMTNVIIVKDENGKLSGGYNSRMGKSGSFKIRETVGSSGVKEYEKKIRDQIGPDLNIEHFEIDSLKKYDLPVSMLFDFDVKTTGKEEILYFNPILNGDFKTNPFKSAERRYPVEMPYKIDDVYVLNMDIPAGYQVDELPQSARVVFNENEGMFEYLVQKSESDIQMRVRLKLDKTFIPVNEYATLRDFFAIVVKKESEQIVFKRIK